jgi:acylphosphatase
MDKRLHAVVTGKVQGVGFRSFVEMRAMALDLTGWVRNLYSGEVEVTAEGPEDTLSFFLSDLERGPQMSRVTNVQVDWQPATDEFPSFDVRSTWISD